MYYVLAAEEPTFFREGGGYIFKNGWLVTILGMYSMPHPLFGTLFGKNAGFLSRLADWQTQSIAVDPSGNFQIIGGALFSLTPQRLSKKDLLPAQCDDDSPLQPAHPSPLAMLSCRHQPITQSPSYKNHLASIEDEQVPPLPPPSEGTHACLLQPH